MTIGQRIAQLRKQQNLSQEGLGERMGVSRQAISKWESDAALPEVDKLIALSRQFQVTVGYLLGVEEEPASPEEAEGEDAAAQVLERYLAALPRQRRGSRWFVLAAVLICAAVCVACFCVARSVSARIAELNNQVSDLNSQVAGLESQVGGLSGSLSEQMADALEKQYGVTASADLTLLDVDYQSNTATVGLSAVPRNSLAVEDGADLDKDQYQFFATAPDGEVRKWTSNVFSGDTHSVTATVTVPLRDGISYFLTLPEGTVQIVDEDYAVTNLGYLTEMETWGYWYGGFTSVSDRLDVSMVVELHIPLAPGLEEEFRGDRLCVTMEVFQNGEKLTNLKAEPDEEYEAYTGAVYPEEEYGAAYSGALKLDGADCKEGDEITVRYQIDSPDGRTGTGWCEVGFVWHAATGWSTLEVDPQSGEAVYG